MTFVLLCAAFAKEPPRPEEILVFGDPFLRWEQRWLVDMELVLPDQMSLLARNNHEVMFAAVQTSLVLDCSKDGQQSKYVWEVMCTVEDIQLRVAERSGDAQPGTSVLAELEEDIIGVRLQLQARSDGRLLGLDLEGLDESTRRLTQRKEGIRQLLLRAMAPFHLQWPKPVLNGKQWAEYNDQMMKMPSRTASRGSSTLMHRIDQYRGKYVVQSAGTGAYQTEAGATRTRVRDDVDGWRYYTTKMRLDAVGVVDPNTGILTERAWTVYGSTDNGMGYIYQGQFRMLNPSEPMTLEPSLIVAKPRAADNGLPPWTPGHRRH